MAQQAVAIKTFPRGVQNRVIFILKQGEELKPD